MGTTSSSTPTATCTWPPTARPPAATRQPGPAASPAEIDNLTETMHDYVFDIKKGGYYGQPNITRGEYILNGGNPTSRRRSQ